jgi:hypothetical protein
MGDTIGKEELVRRLVRVVVGLVVILALAYVWLPHSTGYWIPLGMLLMGLIGGVLMGSRWSIPLTPATIMTAGQLWRRIECADCPPGTDPPPAVWLVYMAVMLGLAALGAQAGAWGERLVSRTRLLPQKPSDRHQDSSDTP